MIFINLSIQNPFSDRFQNIKCWSGALPIAFKFWELQILKGPDILEILFEITARRDHAGLRLEFGLLGFNINFSIYDSRHWNHFEQNWEHND